MHVDFHSHVLPGTDHGSLNLEMSLSQLEYAKAAGVDTIVATPHFYIEEEESVREFLERREKAFSLLCENNKSGITVVPAAEVRLAIGVSELADLPKLCIGDTKYILLEFPEEPWPYWLFDFVSEIIEKRGLSPIIAHVDRYSERGREKLLSLGLRYQVNARALTHFGRRKKFISLVNSGMIDVIGSDTHGSGESSYRIFSKAIRKLGDANIMLADNARKILAAR